MNLFTCIAVLETNIVFVLQHVQHPWLRSMKDQWNVNKFYSIQPSFSTALIVQRNHPSCTVTCEFYGKEFCDCLFSI
jgi:hypothetical protein